MEPMDSFKLQEIYQSLDKDFIPVRILNDKNMFKKFIEHTENNARYKISILAPDHLVITTENNLKEMKIKYDLYKDSDGFTWIKLFKKKRKKEKKLIFDTSLLDSPSEK